MYFTGVAKRLPVHLNKLNVKTTAAVANYFRLPPNCVIW